MKDKITALLNNEGSNFILPFLWMHGENEATLREYMYAIYNSGIGAVCLESRPHPDFCGPGWWHDVSIIIEEAKKYDMKVWILDDEHFPTGYANGALKTTDPSRCKLYINYNSIDVCGPLPQIIVDVTGMATYKPSPFEEKAPRWFTDDKLLSVIACKLDHEDHVEGNTLDITGFVKDGKLLWDVPKGMWRLLVIYETRNGGGRSDYINMMDESSCHLQIEAVYEPHYEHFKEEFGKTLVGFFSDEPCIDNFPGYSMEESIGRKQMPLPWSPKLKQMMKETLGQEYTSLLPALWMDMGSNDLTAKIRYTFMDIVTNLVKNNFSFQLGNWCEEHGVMYIGHIIEDNNQHSRLGCSMGHFFRSMAGQHMSGIDDIGTQVLIGGENHNRRGPFGIRGDGEFCHFALGKLGSSLGHIDPRKNGKTMCEIFGNYGWEEGTRLMLTLTNHFIVRGVNYFVPHAFSLKDFPDPDCPPHFYAHGLNPLYKPFGKLMRYMNRLCNLTSDGRSIAPVALLYHGEAEWTGKAMFNQKPARVLQENQIDFDILPSDVFAHKEYFKTEIDKTLKVNGNEYKAFVVPYCEFITKEVAEFIIDASKKGFPVCFIDGLPSGICNASTEETEQFIRNIASCQVVELSSLAKYLRDIKISEISLDKPFQRLRYYHYVSEGSDLYLFNNEDPGITFDGKITVPTTGNVYIYDAMENAVHPIVSEQLGNQTILSLKIEPYEMKAIVFSDLPAALTAAPISEGTITDISNDWKVSYAEASREPIFGPISHMKSLESITLHKHNFSGIIRYEKTVSLSKTNTASLEIENAYESVELWVNQVYVGMKIAPPYRFDISSLVNEGNNNIRIEVSTTLENLANLCLKNNQSSLSEGAILENPQGIVGAVTIFTK